MKPAALSSDEMALWHAWKLAGEAVMAQLARDILAATALSGADFGILSRLEELGNGELREQDLADAMRWDRSRLSHQLTRMERRDLIARRPAGAKGVIVVLARAGRQALAAARPVHAASIRRHLFAPLTARQRAELLATCTALGATTARAR